jgi:hypothetical protein
MILPVQNLLFYVRPHPGHCLLQLQVHSFPSCTTSIKVLSGHLNWGGGRGGENGGPANLFIFILMIQKNKRNIKPFTAA